MNKQIDAVVHQINQMNRQLSELLDVTRLQANMLELHLQENVDLVAKVLVSVQDHGDGIAESDQVHIFDRFYRAHRRQTEQIKELGLGLYTVAEIVKQHGGNIELSSSPGQGDTFSFTLPFSKS